MDIYTINDDLISRQAAIKAICEDGTWLESQGCTDISMAERKQRDADILSDLPSAQSEVKPIEYRDCANAMLRMWMDGVVTDGEYGRIMDKLNAYWRAKKNEQGHK